MRIVFGEHVFGSGEEGRNGDECEDEASSNDKEIETREDAGRIGGVCGFSGFVGRFGGRKEVGGAGEAELGESE